MTLFLKMRLQTKPDGAMRDGSCRPDHNTKFFSSWGFISDSRQGTLICPVVFSIPSHQWSPGSNQTSPKRWHVTEDAAFFKALCAPEASIIPF